MKKPARILIVEDESIVADDLETSLQRLGYEPVGIVDTGEEAVTKALELRPDLVLMDINLKGRMDGIQAARKLRAPHYIPVVFLTAHSDRSTLELAGLSEPFGYLGKPFRERDIHSTIEIALYRQQAEARLRKLERWLATTLRSIADAVIATDIEGRVTYMNPTAELLTGWTLAEARQQPWQSIFAIFQSPDGAQVSDLVEQALADGIVVDLDHEHHLSCRDGTDLSVDESVAPIRDDDGQVIGAVIVFRESSSRRQAEARLRQSGRPLRAREEEAEQLRTANAELVRANEELQSELESLGFSISHDLKVPLRAIRGFAAVLQEEHQHALDEDGRQLLQIIANNSTKMGEMIDGFLALLRLGRAGLHCERLNMNALVADAVRTELAGRPGGQVQVDLQPLPEVSGDGTLLGQVWANLVANAVKFSSGRTPPIITISGRQTADEAIYTVQDNGVGFDPAYAGKLFGAFRRLHSEEEFPGHGIGLANVQRIMTLHGGRVWADGLPDQGATFHFALPLNPTPQPVPAA